jgi:hypothetical protein
MDRYIYEYTYGIIQTSDVSFVPLTVLTGTGSVPCKRPVSALKVSQVLYTCRHLSVHLMSEYTQSIRRPAIMKAPTSVEDVQWGTKLLNVPGICIS